jgi:hypothetical protein
MRDMQIKIQDYANGPGQGNLPKSADVGSIPLDGSTNLWVPIISDDISTDTSYYNNNNVFGV